MAAQRRSADMTLGTLLAGFAEPGDRAGLAVHGLSFDSRNLRPGDVFVALPGTRDHGMRFAAAAAAAGAVAVLCPADDYVPGAGGEALLIPVRALRERAGAIASRFYGDPSHRLALLAVTGTDGKTSVSHLLAQALDGEPGHCGLLGTLGHGRVASLESFGLTTPGADELQRLLAGFVAAGMRHAVMEASSHALDQRRLDGSRVAVAVLTNLGRDHLDYHGGVAEYAASKARLFDFPELSAAVLNLDDPFGRRLADGLPARVRALGYSLAPSGLGDSAGLCAVRCVADAAGVTLDLGGAHAGAQLRAPLLGDFNAANLLAAATALLALGWPLARAIEALAASRPIPGRMEYVRTSHPATLVVDYAHTPQALGRALAALRPLTRARLWCVFGCGGDRDRGKRALMGALAEQHADRVIVTDDNPRDEDPEAITAEILKGMRRAQGVQVVRPRERALHAALSGAGAGDVVLVAGKGHEDYQIVGGERLPFDDREVLRRLAAESSR